VKSRVRLIVTLIAICGLSNPVWAWNSFGHMVVASVAYRSLDSQTLKKVNTLIALNPYYKSKWPKLLPAGVKGNDRKRMMFMLAATWPDEIKSDNQYHNDGSGNGDVPNGPESTRDSGYDDFNRHKYWHFVDHPLAQDGTDPGSFTVPTPNAETQINAFIGVLRSNSPARLKSYDLVWLLHLIGDVHQPLHCATRLSSDSPQGDNGGNDEIFCTVGAKSCTETSKSKLHAFWDDILGTSESVASADKYAASLEIPSVADFDTADPDKWIQASLLLAKQNVYVSPVGAGNGPFTATQQYTTDARALANKQVALAGARLAAVLKAAFNPPNQ
jgi:S1/P1 Nuclease